MRSARVSTKGGPEVPGSVARLPVREVVSASRYVADLTLGLGEVVFDYLKQD